MYLLILLFYAASGGEYNPKRFNVFTTKTIINILSREVLFKIFYAFGVSTIMFLVDSYRARRST